MQETSPSVAMVSPVNFENSPLLDGLRARNFHVFPAPESQVTRVSPDAFLGWFSPLDHGAIATLSPWLVADGSPVVVAAKSPPSQTVELALLRQGVEEVVAVGDGYACDPLCAAILRSVERHRYRRAQAQQRSADTVSSHAQAVIDLFPVAVLIAREDGTVRLSNSLARDLIAQHQAVYVDPIGRVRLTHRQGDADLYATIHALQTGADIDCALAAPRRDGGAALSVLVVPVGSGVNGQPRGVTLFISDPQQSLAISPETLEGLYGFTVAEAKLVIALVSGQTLDMVATATGTSPNTLRNQLKAVFRKTGTNRQAELMKRVLTGPAVFRRAPAP